MNVTTFNKNKTVELFLDSDGNGQLTLQHNSDLISIALSEIHPKTINQIIAVLEDFTKELTE